LARDALTVIIHPYRFLPPSNMPYVTEFMTFAVVPGKEARAEEWLQVLQARQSECIATLDREHMHFESIFRHQENGRLYLSWLSVQGQLGEHVASSEHQIDKVHMAFWQECIDRSVPPVKHQHVVNFVPPELASAIAAREQVLQNSAGSQETPSK
jgi:Family of unknown function (DUF6176)